MSNYFLTTTFIVSFFIGWIGMFFGILLSFFLSNRSQRIEGIVMGFVGGLMLSTVCFDLLPESFKYGYFSLGLISVVFALLLAAYLEGCIEHKNHVSTDNRKHTYFNSALLMALGIGIHNIPGGIALGSLLGISIVKGLHLGIILLLHGNIQ